MLSFIVERNTSSEGLTEKTAIEITPAELTRPMLIAKQTTWILLKTC